MNLPLLKYVIDFFQDVDLSNCSIVGAQHLLGTTFDLFNHLFGKGLDPQKTFVIGKCYSSSQPVGKELEKAGIYVCPSSFKFISHIPFDMQYSKNMEYFLKKVLPKAIGSKRIIFLDDGGYLVKLAHDILSESDFSSVFSVEQTTSGYDTLKSFNLKFPVINVARSFAKLTYESPMIAEVIASHVHKSLNNLKLAGRKTLVIGGGAIGKSVYERIRLDFEAKIFDLNAELSMIESKDLNHSLSTSDLIIGCTGKTILGSTHYKLLKKGVVLVSASSSDREFEAFHFRRKIPPFKNPHTNIRVNGVNLLNGGFPINFSGHKHSVPAKLIQLTRSLLACGILQGLSKDILTSGIIPLDVELQRNIVRKFLEINGSGFRKIVRNIPDLINL